MKKRAKWFIGFGLLTVLLATILCIPLLQIQLRYPVIETPVITETAPTRQFEQTDYLGVVNSENSQSNAKSKKSETVQEVTNLEQIFSGQTTSDSDPHAISLITTGDVLLARSVNNKMRQLNDFTWPFQKIAPLLEEADIAYINLETPLINDCPSKIDGMIFCGDTQSVIGLRYAGIDVVNIANNHAANYGLDGVIETESLLRNAGLVVSGRAGNTAGYTTVKGTRFAFLGYNEVNEQPGVSSAIANTIQAEVMSAKTQADVVIVQFHWGTEYTYTPTTNQQRLAHLAIDGGADLIIGNHPHWYQPIEFYKGKLITYSHGNLIFDQMWSRETREGIIGKYVFKDKKLLSVEFIPILIENYGQPRLMDAVEAQKVIDRLEAESYHIESPH